MTIGQLIAALASLPDPSAPAVLLLDGRLIEVRAVTFTSFEPHPAAPTGIAVVRADSTGDTYAPT